MSNDQTTKMCQLNGTLSDLAQAFAIVTPYASTDKPALQLIQITGNTLAACDSYAAIRHTNTAETFTTSHNGTEQRLNGFTLPAGEVSKALTAAAKLAGKRAQQITATLTATPDTWTLTTNEGQTMSGNNPQHETPNTGVIWTTAQNTETTTFQPFSLAQWQIERLAKTTKQVSYGKDQPATLTHYSSPIKPVIYTITTPTSSTLVLVMPTRLHTTQ